MGDENFLFPCAGIDFLEEKNLTLAKWAGNGVRTMLQSWRAKHPSQSQIVFLAALAAHKMATGNSNVLE